MKLFELCTTGLGESYVRCYCWAETENRARELFAARHSATDALHPNGVRELFDASSGEFITACTDHGFPEGEIT